ncbi:ferredoxin [bacterium]|nr:ferredoxin [bacterium]
MKVTIDEGLCTGCSLCVTDLPEVFEMGDDGLAKVKVAAPEGDLAARAKDTAPTCPAAAIIIEE